MEVIYIDSLFFLNLLADYLLCLSAGRLCGCLLRRSRYALAAAVGALYAVASYLPGLGFLSAPVLRLLAGFLMGAVAFGAERRPLRCIAVLFLVCAVYGGALWAVSLALGSGGAASLSLRAFLAAFALLYALLRLLSRARGLFHPRPCATVRLRFLGRECVFPALLDSGNSLSDPLSGARVLVASPQALRPVLKENTSLFTELSGVELLMFCDSVPALKGRLRLLPYRSLGGDGLLPLFRPDNIIVDGEAVDDLLVAVSPQAAGDGFEAVL